MPEGIPFFRRVCYNKDKQSSVMSKGKRGEIMLDEHMGPIKSKR